MITLATIASLMSATQAQAACWTNAEATAAQVQNLNMMLMVSALRCRVHDQGILSSYNSFVSESRALLTAANGVVRSHFGGNLNDYDRHSTSIANSFGSGLAGQNCSDTKDVMSQARAAESQWGLARVAENVGLSLRLPGGRCTATAQK